jgi:transposase-like protein
MDIERSYAKGSVKVAAAELGIDAGKLSKWRQTAHHSSATSKEKTGLSAEQIEIKRLQKQLKEAQLERDILKKAVSIIKA